MTVSFKMSTPVLRGFVVAHVKKNLIVGGVRAYIDLNALASGLLLPELHLPTYSSRSLFSSWSCRYLVQLELRTTTRASMLLRQLRWSPIARLTPFKSSVCNFNVLNSGWSLTLPVDGLETSLFI